ncbi:MAG: amidohydrolase family protein [Xanthomonadales bacterium]|nr:amidohydrolase family protein [Xanthomonadales bacterium]
MRPGLFLLLLFPAFAQAGTVSIAGCERMFDARSGKMLGARTILARDGRISAILEGIQEAPDEAFVHADDERVFVRGQTCLPGLIDLHVHLSHERTAQSYSEGFRLDPEDFAFRSVPLAERTLLAGFTTVRDLGGEVALSLRDAINQGLVRGPRIVAAGKAIATTGGHADPRNGINRDLLHALGYPGPEDGVISGPIEARRAVRQRYKEGSDTIKITATGGVLSYAKSADNPQFQLDEIQAVVDTAHDYGYIVAAHAHGAEGIKRAVLAGVDTIEHGTYMTAEIMKLMKEHGTWYVPTITAGDYVSEKAKIEGFYPEIVRPKAAKVGPQIQGTFAKAYQAGVKIAFGTDAGVFPHGQNAREFVLMVEAGMPANEALQAATVRAAEVLRMSDDIGSLDVGKRADLVIVPGDPLQDITTMQQVGAVMKDGSWVSGAGR